MKIRLIACLAAAIAFPLGALALSGNPNASVQQPNSRVLKDSLKEAPVGNDIVTAIVVNTAFDQLVANSVAPPNIVGCHDPTNAIVQDTKVAVGSYGNVADILSQLELRVNGPNSPSMTATELVAIATAGPAANLRSDPATVPRTRLVAESSLAVLVSQKPSGSGRMDQDIDAFEVRV